MGELSNEEWVSDTIIMAFKLLTRLTAAHGTNNAFETPTAACARGGRFSSNHI